VAEGPLAARGATTVVDFLRKYCEAQKVLTDKSVKTEDKAAELVRRRALS